jgi:ribose/xylose/arabinose/galactoside ABC-type transport system permease subunit
MSSDVEAAGAVAPEEKHAAPAGPPQKSSAERLLLRVAMDRPLLLVALIAVVVVVMTITSPKTFPTFGNGAVVLLDTAQTGILACGMMVLMIGGMFDLSIGGIMAFSGIIAGLAAKDMGLPPLVAFLAGFAGALLASRLNTAVVLAGTGVELKVITAVVLGGASLAGGVGTIPGAFLGVLFMAIIQNAMIVAGINPFWQQIAVGLVLLISVGLDQFARARIRV